MKSLVEKTWKKRTGCRVVERNETFSGMNCRVFFFFSGGGGGGGRGRLVFFFKVEKVGSSISKKHDQDFGEKIDRIFRCHK